MRINFIYSMCYCLMQRTFSTWKRFDLPYQFSNTCKLEHKALNIITTFNEKVIIDRANILRSKSDADENKITKVNEEDNISGNKKRTAFLDMLLTNTVDGVNLPDQMIRDEVATFMFAVRVFIFLCLENYLKLY